jgi:hypothetical protein
MVPLFTDDSDTWQQHLDVEVTGLQMMLKLISLVPETQADTTLHVRDRRSQHGKRDCSSC